jgi:hypothetical protein
MNNEYDKGMQVFKDHVRRYEPPSFECMYMPE